MHSAGNIIPIIITLLVSPACLDDTAAPAGAREVDGPPVTRSEAVLTADRYARAKWTMSEANLTGIRCGGTFTSRYPVGERTGVGYKWGGWTGLEEFLEKIDEGYATGTGGGVTWETIPFECVVGVSCTGLVSRAWQLNNKYTLNYADPDIPRKFQEITHGIEGVDIAAREVSGLKKGDVLINSTHVMLFVYESLHGMAMIIDSSYEGVRFRPVSWSDLAGYGYKAIRYNNICEDPFPAGTVSNPILLDASRETLVIEGNTRDVVSLLFHSYSIAPHIRETGPEVIYVIEMDSPGTIEASITQFKEDGIDNDLHLLGSLSRDGTGMALGCIARGDSFIGEELPRGTYYLIVDSRSAAPGEYTLAVTLH